MNHNWNVPLNLRQEAECGPHNDVLIFDAVQFFLRGLKSLFLWGLQPQDILQEDISWLILSPKSEFNMPPRTKLILGHWKGPNHITEIKEISSILMKVCPSLEPSSKQTFFEVLLNRTKSWGLLRCFCMCLHFARTASIRSRAAKKISYHVWQSKSQKFKDKRIILITYRAEFYAVSALDEINTRNLDYSLTMNFRAKLFSTVWNPH